MPKEAVKVLISGAAGQIGYSLIPLVVNGQVFGPDQPVVLHLLDIPYAEKALQGVVMEIEDGAYPLLEDVKTFISYDGAFEGVQYCFLVGGFPRKKGMLRKDLLAKNKDIFEGTGKAIEAQADKNIKVLVVANPANTNALICSKNAPSVPRENFTAMTRLDHNRASAQIASRLGVKVRDVKNIIIWGNHSATQVPDAGKAVANIDGKSVNCVSKFSDEDKQWLDGEFIKTVQSRGAAVIAARGLSSAMSAANAAKDQMRDWVRGTKDGEHVSMAIFSKGQYGVAEDIVFSFPVTCKDGKCTVVEGVELTDKQKELVKATQDELLEEKTEASC